jgi:spermidine synthase
MNLAQTLSPDKQAKLVYMDSSLNDRITIYQNENYTWLLVRDVIQSAIENQRPYRPILHHCFVMLLPMLHHKTPNSILELGGGGLAIQRYLSYAYPSIKVTSIEGSQKIIDVVDEYFPAIDQPSVIKQDAFSFIDTAHQNQAHYDWIISDLFQGDESPILIKNQRLFKQLYDLINPNGWLIVNCLIDNDEDVMLLGDYLKQAFNNKHYIFAVPNMQNHILMLNKIEDFSFPEDIELWNKAK